ESPCHAVAARPRSYGQLDGGGLACGIPPERQRQKLAYLRGSFDAPPLETIDHLFSGGVTPGDQDVFQQLRPMAEMPVEAAPGDLQLSGQRIDPYGIYPVFYQCG